MFVVAGIGMTRERWWKPEARPLYRCNRQDAPQRGLSGTKYYLYNHTEHQTRCTEMHPLQNRFTYLWCARQDTPQTGCDGNRRVILVIWVKGFQPNAPSLVGHWTKRSKLRQPGLPSLANLHLGTLSYGFWVYLRSMSFHHLDIGLFSILLTKKWIRQDWEDWQEASRENVELETEGRNHGNWKW